MTLWDSSSLTESVGAASIDCPEQARSGRGGRAACESSDPELLGTVGARGVRRCGKTIPFGVPSRPCQTRPQSWSGRHPVHRTVTAVQMRVEASFLHEVVQGARLRARPARSWGVDTAGESRPSQRTDAGTVCDAADGKPKGMLRGVQSMLDLPSVPRSLANAVRQTGGVVARVLPRAATRLQPACGEPSRTPDTSC
jgi:hypothetical protein